MLYETKVLLDRVLPLEQAGEWRAAIEICQEAYRMSIVEKDAGNLTEAILREGICYRQTGERELAKDLLQLASRIAEGRGDHTRQARALNGLGTISHMHGELAEAERFYTLAEVAARLAGDTQTAGHLHQNMGALAAVRGNISDALAQYEKALECHRSSMNRRGLAGVLNNIGTLQISQGTLPSAEANLKEALLVASELGDIVTEGIVQLNLTELHIAIKDLEAARGSCDQAFEIFSRLGERGSAADALRFYGIIYRDSDKIYLAESHLRQAVEVAREHEYPHEEAEALRELAHVLRVQNRNKEALLALNRSHELFTHLQAIHKQADIDRRIHGLKDDFVSLVTEWGESIEAKDRYTRGHCQRVAEYACAIAGASGMSDNDIFWFKMGAFLHDVGKTEIPAGILNKPGRLTDRERELVEKHTIFGDEILSSVEFPWDVRPMVRSHHERWDGRGYPDGLAGEDIPFTARILRIADVFDALTSNRSYRTPLTADQALQIMKDDEGAFDPVLLPLFESCLHDILEQNWQTTEVGH